MPYPLAAPSVRRRRIPHWPGAALAVAALLSLVAACQDAAAPSPASLEALRPANLETAPFDSLGTVLATPVTGPQGQIAFASDRSGSFDIYVVDVANGRTHRLTREKFAENEPAWSPDGKTIAFVSDRDGSAEVYVMNAAGDVTRVTFSNGWVGDPEWSPDGTKIAYTSGSGLGGADVFVSNADGTGAALNLTNDMAYDTGPAWSPDGTRIAFASTRSGATGPVKSDIYVMRADGTGGVTQLTTGGGQDPAWSPDGQRIAFSSVADNKWKTFVVNADGTGSPVNLTNDPERSDLSPSWSSDGTKIAFSSGVSGRYDIYIMNADGSGVTRVGRSSGFDQAPAWRP